MDIYYSYGSIYFRNKKDKAAYQNGLYCCLYEIANVLIHTPYQNTHIDENIITFNNTAPYCIIFATNNSTPIMLPNAMIFKAGFCRLVVVN